MKTIYPVAAFVAMFLSIGAAHAVPVNVNFEANAKLIALQPIDSESQLDIATIAGLGLGLVMWSWSRRQLPNHAVRQVAA